MRALDNRLRVNSDVLTARRSRGRTGSDGVIGIYRVPHIFRALAAG